ncbi:MAG: hypothetical protein M3303_12010, partial [Gemmatimonadota bacterium]|nr:hypothetical protein [Gemmatimonadota bacterium]
MRIAGTLLMLLGAFAFVAVALAVFGPGFQTRGINVGGAVTSVPGTLVAGTLAFRLWCLSTSARAR